MAEYDPTNPPPDVTDRERARDLRLELAPPADPVERQVVEDWLEGTFDYAQTQEYNHLVDAIDAKWQQLRTGTN